MTLASIFDFPARAIAWILDVCAAPATLALTIRPATSVGERIVLASAATLTAWLMLALIAYVLRRWSATFFEVTFLDFACASGNLDSMRRTVVATYRVVATVNRVANFFGASNFASGYRQTDVRTMGSNKKRKVARLLSRGAISGADGIGTFVVWLVRLLWTRIFWVLTLVVSWACFRPDPSFWESGPELVREVMEFLSANSVFAWITVSLLLVAVLSSVRVRGAHAWRIEKSKQANSALDLLANQAAEVSFHLWEAINRVAQRMNSTVSQATSASTASWGHFGDDSWLSDFGLGDQHRVVWMSAPSSGFDNCALNRRGNRTDDQARSLREEAARLRTKYVEYCLQVNLKTDVLRLLPRETIPLVLQLSLERRGIASGAKPKLESDSLGWHVDLLFFADRGVDQYLERWIDANGKCLRQQFEAVEAGEQPDERLKRAAEAEIQNLVGEIRSKLIRACWLEVQLNDVANAGLRNRYPGWLKNVMATAGSR